MTTEPVDPLVQLEADEAADRASAAEAVVGEQSQGQAEQPAQPETPAEPAQQHPWAERFKSDDELWRGYQNLEAKFRERDDELGELRQFRQQAEPIIQQAYQQQQAQQQPQFGQQPQVLPDGTPIFTSEQMQEIRDEDPAAYADLMVRYRTYELETRFEERLDQALADRLGPLETAHIDRGARDILDRVTQELGADVVADNSEFVSRRLREDRAHYADPKHGAQRLKEAILYADFERRQNGGAAPAREPVADVHVEGGSGAQPSVAGGTRMSPEEQEIVDSLTWSRPVDEQGIPLPQ